jgi:hypothetical protein
VQPAEEADGELPDWLSQEAPEMDTPPAEQPAEEEAGLPAWLSGGEDESLDWLSQKEDEGQVVAEQPAGEEAGLPDWLSGGEDESPDQLSQDEGQVAAEQPAEEETDLPDWLAGVEDEEIDWSPPEIAAPAAPSAGDDESLDWLSQEEGEPVAAGQPSGEEEIADWLSGDGLPDWLADEGVQGAVAAEVTDASDSDLEAGQEQVGEDLEWLGELEEAFPEMPSDAEVAQSLVEAESGEGLPEIEAAFGDSLPGWMDEMEAEPDSAEPEAVEPLAGEEDQEIMPAELPSWLEAMRPVTADDAAAELDAQIAKGELVSAGPLMGLRGVLPAEPDAAQTSKPPIYSVKLQVSDLQKSHADLLGQLLEMEGEPRPIPSQPVVTTQHVLRLVIAALLIFTVLVPIVLDLPLVSIPPPPPEVFPITQSLVAGVPEGSAVLVAVDYEPGLSGEMDAVTGPVLDQLMKRGIFLTLVSTRPTGPLQAERLLARLTDLGAPQYVAPQQYVNLGYVPGGAIGLLGFAETPKQVLPRAMIGGSAWGNSEVPSLMGINSLADFAMLVVATENPDTARYWIEQVQPKLGGNPLVMVVSAQAEPMVRPYYEADPKQVQGLVSGLAAGASYEAMSGQWGMAGAYWSAFSAGMLVAGLLMLAGGLVNALSARLRRKKVSTEGET